MRQRVDLVEEMRDDDDGEALGRQIPQHREDRLDLARVEARRRLVEEQHLARQIHRPRDGDDLAHRHRIGVEAVLHVQIEPVARQQGLRVPRHPPPVGQPEPPRLAAEIQVLGHRQVLQQVHLLVDRPDPEALRLRHRARRDLGPVDADDPRVPRQRPGQDLDQGRLARAVLADQRMDLARLQREIHPIERAHPEEGPRDPTRLQHLPRHGPLLRQAGAPAGRRPNASVPDQ